jgi:hypothetical protein
MAVCMAASPDEPPKALRFADRPPRHVRSCPESARQPHMAGLAFYPAHWPLLTVPDRSCPKSAKNEEAQHTLAQETSPDESVLTWSPSSVFPLGTEVIPS